MMGLLKGLQHPWLIWVYIYLNIGKIKPEEQFANAYVEELLGSEHVHTSTKRLHVILFAKNEKADLHKVMETQCQNLTMTQSNKLLKLLLKSKESFDGTLGTWKTDPL